jgi:glycerol-3-phosphate O-acyltransferase
MNIAGFIFRPLYWLAGKVFSIWARPAILPETPAEYLTDPDAEVCYVLETGGLADVLALERACATHGMPSPTDSFEYCGNREYRRYIVLRRKKGFPVRRPTMTGSQRLRRLVEAREGCDKDLLLIPVAIYWGRSPEKERSVLKLLFSENWDAVGRTRKFFATILHGRDTLLRFSHALPLLSLDAGDLSSEIAFRKVSRILRVHFRKRRIATVGPDLSHRRTLINQVLHAPAVRRAMFLESGDDPRKQECSRPRTSLAVAPYLRRYRVASCGDASRGRERQRNHLRPMPS